MKNVIWFQNINNIGGVESVIWNVIRIYKDYDITVLYQNADPFQIKRFSKYVRLLKFTPSLNFECDNLFINYGYDAIKGHFKAKEAYYIIHADYVYQNLECVTDPNFKYLAVSKWAADQYYKKCGIRAKLFPNPILIDEFKKPLLIVSATRISPDKGRMVWRMKTLADELDKRNIPYQWLVYTNSQETVGNPHVVNIPSRLDIVPIMARADFVAQLSDSEACCMTALESLSVGTPLLITKVPSFYEQGANENNSIFFDFDMSNINECIDKMSNEFKFEFTAKKDKWGEVLAKGKKRSKQIEVEVIQDYLDLEFNKNVKVGDRFKVKDERAYYLESLNLVRQVL